MGSSMSRPQCLCSLVLSFGEDPGSSLHASRLLWTRRVGQYRTMCGRSPAATRRSDERSVVDCGRYRSRHRVGSKPGAVFSMWFAYFASGHILPSLRRGELWRSHYPVPNGDCYRGSLEAKTGRQHPSYAGYVLVLVQEREPIARVRAQHRRPCRHGSRSWVCSWRTLRSRLKALAV